MTRLGQLQSLNRRIRQDDASELSKLTLTAASEEMRAGRIDSAQELLDYARAEITASIDSRTKLMDLAVTRIVQGLGEDELEEFWRRRFESRARDFLATTATVEESLQRLAEMYRSLLSNFTITEEPDKYVIKLDPCGSGGRLRRAGQVAVVQAAHPWSWGRSGVSIYCTHCCVNWELIPSEVRGYPVKVCVYNDDPRQPCIQYVYKKPELVPAEFLRRIGR